jgi:hypothetical protein
MELYGTAIKMKQCLSSKSHSAMEPMADIVIKTSAMNEKCSSIENARNRFSLSLI